MEDFALVIENVFRFLSINITLWGYTFSLWQIFLFDGLAGIVGYVIFRIFSD